MYKIINKVLIFVLLLSISPSLALDSEIQKKDLLYERANDWLNINSSETSQMKLENKKKIVADKEFSFIPSQDSKMEKFIKRAKQIFSSDPLSISRKSVDEQGRVSMFRPIRLGFVNFYNFKFRLTNTMSYARDLGNEQSVSLGLNYSPLVLKAPFGNMKMDSWDLNLGYRKYFNEKYFFQSNIGLRKYHPNNVYRSFFSSRGQQFNNERLPYMSVGVGRKIWNEVPIIKRPLVLIANYTFSEDLKYPSADPFGHNKIDLKGLDITVSVSFKI